MSSSCGLIN